MRMNGENLIINGKFIRSYLKHTLFLLAIALTLSINLKGQDTTVLKRTPYILKIEVDKKNF